MVVDLLWIIIKIVGSLFSTVCGFRAYLKYINLHPNSPLYQMVVRFTDWVSNPLSKLFPISSRYDWGSIAGSVLIAFIVAVCFYITHKIQNANSSGMSGFNEFIQPFGLILLLGIFWLFDWCLHLIIVFLIIHVILSWVSPATKIGTLRPIVELIVSPLLIPFQKIIFKGNPKFTDLNFDPSPIALFVILQILFLINDRVVVEIIEALF